MADAAVAHAPLAVGSDGSPVELPDDAASWRVKRQTGGRPRQVLDANREPLELSLETSPDDLLDVVGPGAFRLEAVDADGELVDCVVSLRVGEEESEPIEQSGHGQDRPPVRSRTSDLRATLDANVSMARALSDAVRVLAEAQADWTKGLAVARAIPRNAKGSIVLPAALPAPPPPPVITQVVAEPQQEPAEPEPAGWVHMVATFVDTVGKENVPHLINALPALVGEVIDRFKKPRVVEVPVKAEAKGETK